MPNPADRVIDLYEQHAPAYIADRGNRIHVEQAWMDRFTALLAPGASILDIGCGSGAPIAQHLIERGFAVSGVDGSPALIAQCRERFPDRHWQVADMRTLALDKTFQGLLAWDSLFHLGHDDQRRMFPIFKQHAAAGAALMFTTGPAHGEAIGEYQGEPLYHASLAPEEYRSLLAANGFRLVACTLEDPDCGGHSVWLVERTTM